jgi:hypothetical protein
MSYSHQIPSPQTQPYPTQPLWRSALFKKYRVMSPKDLRPLVLGPSLILAHKSGLCHSTEPYARLQGATGFVCDAGNLTGGLIVHAGNSER